MTLGPCQLDSRERHRPARLRPPALATARRAPPHARRRRGCSALWGAWHCWWCWPRVLQHAPLTPWHCAQLSDFGLAKLLRENYYIVNRSGSGTVTHLAPELFQVCRLQRHGCGYDKALDPSP